MATLKQGDYFGENALLRNEPRSATIKAMTEIKTLKITQEKFQELGSNTSKRTSFFSVGLCRFEEVVSWPSTYHMGKVGSDICFIIVTWCYYMLLLMTDLWQ